MARPRGRFQILPAFTLNAGGDGPSHAGQMWQFVAGQRVYLRMPGPTGWASVAVRRFARILSLHRSELPNQSDTGNSMILVSLLNPKFTKGARRTIVRTSGSGH